MKRGKRIGVCLFILCAILFFWYLVEKDERISEKTLVRSEIIPVSTGPSYYMKLQGEQIIIFNRDHSVFEYTDLDPDFLPVEILKKLSQGMDFEDQEELYEFLETYSS